MENQTSINGKKIVNKDTIIIKYEGPSFDNKMELHSFTKQITSVERILKETIDILNKTQKVKDTSKQPRYYLELRKGSFETILLIIFSNPILINVVSDCIFEYIKYLATGVNRSKYKREIENLTNNKNIRTSTRDIINPCVSNADKITIINGDVNNTFNTFIIDTEKRLKIDETLLNIEDKIPIEEYEQELIGRILKLDAVKSQDNLSKSKLGFVIEGQQQSVESSFENNISEEEFKRVLVSRIKINAIVTYKGGDIIKILIKSYELALRKKLDSYMN